MLKSLDALISVSGRATRAEFWATYLGVVGAYFLLFLLLTLVAMLLQKVPSGLHGHIQVGMGMGFFTLLIVSTAILMALSWRRLHDLGYSGWWLLGLIPPATIVLLGILGCVKGQTFDNHYGLNPYRETTLPSDEDVTRQFQQRRTDD